MDLKKNKKKRRRPTKICWDRPKARTRSKNLPCARSGHSLAMIGNCGFMFGGIHSGEYDGTTARPLDETHTFQLSKAEVLWTQITPDNPAEPWPLPRWRHSACVANETQVVVFGGHHASDRRLNDVWVFDTMAMTWSESVTNEEEAPSPRAGHSATMMGARKMLVFGGYGGPGDERKDVNDLYELDVVDWTWTLVEAKGQYPERRSGHRACAIDEHGHRLVVFGGWNETEQFADLFVLDYVPSDDDDDDRRRRRRKSSTRARKKTAETTTTTNTKKSVWSQVAEASLLGGRPCWNATASSVLAIPYWKIFVFGGATGPLCAETNALGEPCDTVSILDAGTFKWTLPEVEAAGKRPTPRSDGVLCYDTKSARLVAFGGWGHKFFGELFTLDISLAVGPPYSITAIGPARGPVTGGTELSVAGIDFFRTDQVTVRFGALASTSFVDVRGVFVKNTEIKCVTPDFSESLQAGSSASSGVNDAYVRVALEDDSFTTTCGTFTFHSVTDAEKTLMFGPGLLRGGVAGEPRESGDGVTLAHHVQVGVEDALPAAPDGGAGVPVALREA